MNAELCVFFRCADSLFALPASRVGRLILSRELDDRATGVATIAGTAHALWDLGELIGRRASPAGWITIEVAAAGARVPIALRTGPCLVVRRLAERLPAPSGMFVARTAAFPSIFRADAVVASASPAVGIYLDIDRLWTPAELAASAAELARSTA